MPESPDETRERLLKRGLNLRDVDFLMFLDSAIEMGHDGQPGKGVLAFFEQVSADADAKTASNWYDMRARVAGVELMVITRITHELYNALTANGKSFKESPVSAEHLREIISLVKQGKLTSMHGHPSFYNQR